jgi:mannose-6-phosphate isomerase
VVFEIQQNSDVTFRLYDWDHVDPKTGKPRALKSIRRWPALILRKVRSVRVTPVVETTTPVERERLFHCEHFWLWRLRGQSPFTVGAAGRTAGAGMRRGGRGSRAHGGASYASQKGDVVLLPAVIGVVQFSAPHRSELVGNCALPD